MDTVINHAIGGLNITYGNIEALRLMCENDGVNEKIKHNLKSAQDSIDNAITKLKNAREGE